MIRVMIVEDDPMVAEFNKSYLAKVNGFQLTAMARSVEDAIRIIENQDFDLILLDIFMPGKQGLELLIFLREKEKETDVIIISAASDMDRIQKALRYGAVDYLIKPFEFERFQLALTAYLEKREFIKNQPVTSQDELDYQLLRREEKTILEELPKGLTKDTLKQIWDAIQEMKDGPFSTEDVVKIVGISRVSVRKYLNFLKGIGILEVKVIYGTVGRPVYQHHFNKYKEHLIKNFL
ncbi:two-component system response regulator DcuR [Bacillus sp. AFS076308]|uniref:response regulator n=1 Tax=Bacillaceae TaxID=186817 RepID=UPI000BF3ED4E|nr:MULTISPECIES: response regulator [unclassified Bacillus (in: firmicutes)]PFN95904.1 two-component system response regulator DcuR [Bacillus sp. AFS076308]PGV49219.1 two-component system response regulator DcuR [Bacillus sp. AFS037270]